MSIINQALKKAQREQLLHHRGDFPPVGSHATASPSRWQWSLLAVGMVCVLGAGVGGYAWYTAGSREAVVVAPTVSSAPQSSQPSPSRPKRLPRVPREPAASASLEVAGSRPPRSGLQKTSRRLRDGERVTRVLQPRSTLGSRPRPRIELPSSSASLPVRESQSEVVPRTSRQRITVARTVEMTSAARSQRRPPRIAPAAVPVTPLASPPPTSTLEPSVIPDHLSATELFQSALAAQQAGNIGQALRLFKRASEADPTMQKAYSNLGNLYYQQKQYSEALQAYKQALELDPADVKTRNNLGSTYLQLAMNDRAIEELQQVLRLDKSYGLAYYNLACVHARAGQSRQAVQYLQQAIVLTPEARQWAQTDADFAPVRSHPEVRRLLEP